MIFLIINIVIIIKSSLCRMGNTLITYWNSVSSSISNITTATWSGISYPFTWPSASASGRTKVEFINRGQY